MTVLKVETDTEAPHLKTEVAIKETMEAVASTDPHLQVEEDMRTDILVMTTTQGMDAAPDMTAAASSSEGTARATEAPAHETTLVHTKAAGTTGMIIRIVPAIAVHSNVEDPRLREAETARTTTAITNGAHLREENSSEPSKPLMKTVTMET